MTDAHCHPWNLKEYFGNQEEERRATGIVIAASSWNLEQFEYHEGLAKKAREEGAPKIFCCFALHPQLTGDDGFSSVDISEGIDLLQSFGTHGRLDAVGETGFDLFNESFRAGEKLQDEIFACHLEIAIKYELPLVMHLRRAMHKIFPLTKELKKLPAVVFHSWPGTSVEGEALLKRGINVFFSFGNTVLKNHRQAMLSAAFFPPDRILLETDAPYQPLHGKACSSWRDLDAICSQIAALRKESGSPCATQEELDKMTTKNFFQVFEKGQA